jgi:uncharacterized protein YbjQ (UPF0145 family)
MIDHKNVTTAFELPGQKVTASLGVVRGVVVRSRSIVGNLVGALHSLVGGNITVYTQLCEQARQEAFEAMLEHAEEMGANAVVGVRYESNEVMQGITEVLCYGTAVTIV